MKPAISINTNLDPNSLQSQPSNSSSSSMYNNDRPFQKWLKKNIQTLQTPLLIQKSFQNLQDPRGYNRQQSILALQNQSSKIKQNMQYQRQSISQMSKQTYKKVVTRDKVDYQFGSSNLTGNHRHHSYNDNEGHKREGKKKDQNYFRMMEMRKELKNSFKHNYYQIDSQNMHEIRKLDIQIIKDIDNKDFQKKYPEFQYKEVFTKTQTQKHASVYTDISQNYQMDDILNKLKFSIIDRDSYYSQKSSQLLFKPQDQLDFWRRYSSSNASQTQQSTHNDQIQIMKRCHSFNMKQPTFQHLLDFAAGKIDSDIISSYFRLKLRQEAQLKINQNDQNLQEEYNKKKQEYDFLRQMKMNAKTQRIAVKYTRNAAQTIADLEDQSFDSYFQETGKNMFLRVQELNQMRDNIMENQPQQTKKVMLMNIGYQIKNLLFKILTLILQGQQFANYEQIMAQNEQTQAQKKILQIIYHKFDKIKQLQVDGISKAKILDFYLEERQKNQNVFQLLGRMYANEKSNVAVQGKFSKRNRNNVNGNMSSVRDVRNAVNKIPTKDAKSRTPIKSNIINNDKSAKKIK